SGGADRNHYARTLLGFFETLHAAPRRVWWQGVSMAHAGQAEKRLERILGWKGCVAMHLKKSAVILIISLVVPVMYLAASVRPTIIVAQQPPLPAAPSTPAVAPQPAAPPAAGIRGVAPITGVPAPPAPPLRGVAALPAMPAPPAPAQARRNHRSWYSDFDDDKRFVIVTGKSDSLTMSGSSQDARHVEKLRKQIPGDFIWFQRDEKSYIIRDQATIERAQKLWAPQEELGKKQEELGRQQEELAEKASKEMKQLLDDAIKNGKAQPEPEVGEAGSL